MTSGSYDQTECLERAPDRFALGTPFERGCRRSCGRAFRRPRTNRERELAEDFIHSTPSAQSESIARKSVSTKPSAFQESSHATPDSSNRRQSQTQDVPTYSVSCLASTLRYRSSRLLLRFGSRSALDSRLEEETWTPLVRRIVDIRKSKSPCAGWELSCRERGKRRPSGRRGQVRVVLADLGSRL